MTPIRIDDGSIKFRVIAEHIEKRIIAGDYKPGDVLPSEGILQQQWDSSRITVRNAIELLANKGFVRKERGRNKGTVVLDYLTEQRKIRKGLSFGIILHEDALGSAFTDIPAVVNGIVDNLYLWDANVVLFPFSDNVNQFEYVKYILSRNVIDGLILAGNLKEDGKISEYLTGLQIPCLRFQSSQVFAEQSFAIPEISILETAALTGLFDDKSGEVMVLSGNKIMESRFKLLMRHVALPETLRVVHHSVKKNCLEEIMDILSSIDDFSFIVVNDNDLVSLVDLLALHLKLGREKTRKIVFFKHFAPDWSKWEHKYTIVDRPYRELGVAVGEAMKTIWERKADNLNIYDLKMNHLNSFIASGKK